MCRQVSRLGVPVNRDQLSPDHLAFFGNLPNLTTCPAPARRAHLVPPRPLLPARAGFPVHMYNMCQVHRPRACQESRQREKSSPLRQQSLRFLSSTDLYRRKGCSASFSTEKVFYEREKRNVPRPWGSTPQTIRLPAISTLSWKPVGFCPHPKCLV